MTSPASVLQSGQYLYVCSPSHQHTHTHRSRNLERLCRQEPSRDCSPGYFNYPQLLPLSYHATLSPLPSLTTNRLTTHLPRGPAREEERGTRCGRPGRSHHTVSDSPAGPSLRTHCRHRTCTYVGGCLDSVRSLASSYAPLPRRL